MSLTEPGQTVDVFVATVTCTDTSSFMPIAYTLSGSGSPYFKINSNGDISTNLGIDAYDQGSLSFFVNARNNVGTLVRLSVVVLINDVNDNTPTFGASYTAVNIREDTSSSAIVATLTATDYDVGSNAEISYNITAGNSAGYFSIDVATGTIKPAKILNYELITGFVLTVTASDNGVPKESSSTVLNITITDYNDNIPKFNRTSYTATIFENATVNSAVLTVLATDLDGTSPNNLVGYSILDLVPFDVDPSTGAVYVIDVLDFESNPTYVFGVIATDQGTPALSSSVNVRINLRDVNDNPPTFDSTQYDAVIDEDVSTNTPIVSPFVFDVDSGTNAMFAFTLVAVTPSVNKKFSIDSKTGNVATSAVFDLAVDPAYYELKIRCIDRGIPALTSEALVTVTVNDVNNHAPVFNSSTYTASIAEGSTTETLITVRATDAVSTIQCF